MDTSPEQSQGSLVPLTPAPAADNEQFQGRHVYIVFAAVNGVKFKSEMYRTNPESLRLTGRALLVTGRRDCVGGHCRKFQDLTLILNENRNNHGLVILSGWK